jgi:16S rRNA (guanine966-N2)-methyltransferase
MSIKILGGLAKGQTLLVPKGDLIRPTSVMLRRKIFDARQDLSGFDFYDICAGSGAVALEALSRGADSSTMVEKNAKVFNLTKTNVQTVKKSSTQLGEIDLLKGDGLKWLESFIVKYETLSTPEKESVILFIDPPYAIHDFYKKSLELIASIDFVGELWIESDEQKGLKKSFFENIFKSPKVYSQGTSFILIHR